MTRTGFIGPMLFGGATLHAAAPSQRGGSLNGPHRRRRLRRWISPRQPLFGSIEAINRFTDEDFLDNLGMLVGTSEPEAIAECVRQVRGRLRARLALAMNRG